LARLGDGRSNHWTPESAARAAKCVYWSENFCIDLPLQARLNQQANRRYKCAALAH